MTSNPLSAAQLQKFAEEGYLVVPGLIAHQTLANLVDRVDGMIEGRYSSENCIAGTASNRGDNDPGRLIKQVMPMKYPIDDPVLRASGDDPAIRAVAAQLLGASDVVLFQQQALLKDAGQENGTPWHQDDFYWQTGGFAVTAWFPLEPVYPDSGTMWVITGSHLGAIHTHAKAGGVSAFHSITGGVDETKAVPLLIPLGSVSCHHSKTIHGAYGNKGKVRRIAMAQHYRAKPAD